MGIYPNRPLSPASIDDLAFLEGAWAGENSGEPIEEHWAAAAGGEMMGMFRWLRKGKPWLYELLNLREVGGRIEFHIRHFGADLVAWEEKDQTTAFDLVELTGPKAAFLERHANKVQWLILQRTSENELRAWFATEESEPTKHGVFRYRRI